VRDAQALFDLGHYGAGKIGLAEFHEILGDDLLPELAISHGDTLAFMSKVNRLGVLLSSKKHERMRAVGFDCKLGRKKGVRAIGGAQRFVEFSGNEGVPG
jgi:hypothetical protein